MPGPQRIESRDNRRLVDVRKARDGKISDRIFIEGRRLASEALASGLLIDYAIVTDTMLGSEVEQECTSRGIEVFLVSEKLFDSVADTQTPQNVLLIAKRPEAKLQLLAEGVSDAGVPVVVYLYKINNPSNLGAIIRTVEAAGALGVICSEGSTDPYSPKALRGAMGSAFRLPIVRNVGMDSLAKFARDNDMILTATATQGAESYLNVDLSVARVLMFGSEAAGLTADALKVAQQSLSIPIADQVESLNLAVSAGIILFEARRQSA